MKKLRNRKLEGHVKDKFVYKMKNRAYNYQKLGKVINFLKICQSAKMKIKIWTTKINFILISVFQILGSVGPVKQLIKLVSPIEC